MLKVVGQEKFYDEAREVDLNEAVRYKGLFKTMIFLLCFIVIFSKYISLYYMGICITALFLELGYVLLNPCYELPCTVIRRKTGNISRFKKAFYIDVKTDDDTIWTAKVSRKEYVMAKKGATGYIYFTDKDVEKNKPVDFKF